MRKAVAFVIVVMTFLTITSVNAAVLDDAKVDFSDNTVTITGDVGSEFGNRFVSLQVVNPQKDFNSLFTDSGVLNRSEQTFTDSDGKFKFEFVMNGVSGDYYYFVGVDGMTQTLECVSPFEYFTPDYIKGIWNDILKAIETENDASLKNIIDTYPAVLQIDTSEYNSFSDDTIRQRIRKGIIRNGLNNISEFSEAFNDAIFVSKLRLEANDEVFNAELETVFNGANEKIKALYDKMTSDKKDAIKLKIHDSEFYNSKDILKLFTEFVRLTTLNSKVIWTEIDNFITVEGCFPVEDISAYTRSNDKQAIAVKLMEKLPYSSIDVFVEDLKTFSSNSGSSGGNNSGVGGNSSSSTGKTFPFIAGNAYTTQDDSVTSFSDLTGYDWAIPGITKLKTMGIVSGDGEKFYPGSNVTRAEFLKMVLLCAKIDIASNMENIFTDVNSQEWYAPYINTAAALNIVSGVGNGKFNPSSNISRQDIAVIINNLLKHTGKSLTDDGVIPSDFDEIADYAKDAVCNLAQAGIVTGFEDGTFRGSNFATRAEAAVLIARLSEFVRSDKNE